MFPRAEFRVVSVTHLYEPHLEFREPRCTVVLSPVALSSHNKEFFGKWGDGRIELTNVSHSTWGHLQIGNKLFIDLHPFIDAAKVYDQKFMTPSEKEIADRLAGTLDIDPLGESDAQILAEGQTLEN